MPPGRVFNNHVNFHITDTREHGGASRKHTKVPASTPCRYALKPKLWLGVLIVVYRLLQRHLAEVSVDTFIEKNI